MFFIFSVQFNNLLNMHFGFWILYIFCKRTKFVIKFDVVFGVFLIKFISITKNHQRLSHHPAWSYAKGFGDLAYTYHAPSLCNALPATIRHAGSTLSTRSLNYFNHLRPVMALTGQSQTTILGFCHFVLYICLSLFDAYLQHTWSHFDTK